MSSVERVRQVRMTCGRKAHVVHIPATDPINETQDIATLARLPAESNLPWIAVAR
jgi:hypothetical protein